MAAGTYNLAIEQGATFSLQITLQAPGGGVFSLVGYTIRAQIRRSHSHSKATDLTVTVAPPPATGVFVLGLSAAKTQALDFQTGVWDLEIASGGVVTRVLQGAVEVSPEVTR